MADKAPFDEAGRWPLQGLKVLDMGQVYNGPYAGFLMAQAGADVIKIEPLEGEAIRARGSSGEVPLAHVMLNAGKRGIAVNLKSDDGRALFLDLVDKADVLLENFAPGAMARLGIGSDVLLKRNPRLIYGSSTGYGVWGEEKNNLAMDLTIQAYAGIMSTNGPADGPPLKAGLAVVDFLGGVHLYAALMTALYERSVTGKGRVVEVAMQETALTAQATSMTAMHLAGGALNRPAAATIIPRAPVRPITFTNARTAMWRSFAFGITIGRRLPVPWGALLRQSILTSPNPTPAPQTKRALMK